MLCSGNLCAMPSSAQHASYISRVRASVGRVLCAIARRSRLSPNSKAAARNAMPATHSAIRASADAIVNTGFGESAAGSGSCTGAGASLRNASLGAASRVAAGVGASNVLASGICCCTSGFSCSTVKRWKPLSIVTGMQSRAMTKNHSVKCSAGESLFLNASLKPVTAANNTAEYMVISNRVFKSFIPWHLLSLKANR